MSEHIIKGSLGFLLNRGTQVFHRQLNRNFNANGYKITSEQWSVLSFLNQFDGKSQNEIAEKTFRDKVSTTKIIDNLESRTLAQRRLDKTDRRVKRVFITKAGKEIYPELRKIADNTISEAFSKVNKKDLDSFELVLSKIILSFTGEDILNFISNNKGIWK